MTHTPASLGRRVAAFTLDASGFIALAVLLVAIPAILANTLRMSPATARVVVVVGAVLWLGASVAYGLFLARGKATEGSAGMRKFDIALVDIDDGEPIGKDRAVLRGIVQFASWLSVVGVASPLFDARRRGWHDKTVAAIVVDTRIAPDARPMSNEVDTTSVQAVPKSNDGKKAKGKKGEHDETLIATVPPFETLAEAPPEHDEEVVELAPMPKGGGPVASPQFDDAAPVNSSARAAVTRPEPVQPVDVGLSEEDLATRVSPPRRQASLRLVWDDGQKSVVTALTVVGRDPSVGDLEGAIVIAVPDPTRSLSKTHFAIGFDGGHPYIVDRQSTNGTTVVHEGGAGISLAPGTREHIRPGDTVVIGDRNFRIEDAS